MRLKFESDQQCETVPFCKGKPVLCQVCKEVHAKENLSNQKWRFLLARAFKRYKRLFLSFEIVHRVLKMSGSGGKVWIEGPFKEGQISFSLCPNVLSFLEIPINYNLNSNLIFISDWRILGLHLVQKSIYFRENNISDWSHQRFFFKILMYILHINS